MSHQLTAWRDRVNKRREQRITYLVGVFRSLSKASNHPRLWEVADKVEDAIADIQLSGTEEQIKLAQKFATDLGNHKGASLDLILASLRDDLRREIGSSKVSGRLVWLRIMKPNDPPAGATEGVPPSPEV